MNVWETMDVYTRAWIIATTEAEETLERAYDVATEVADNND